MFRELCFADEGRRKIRLGVAEKREQRTFSVSESFEFDRLQPGKAVFPRLCREIAKINNRRMNVA